MNYEYKDISYSKRPLTDDIALYAATSDLSLAETKSPEFERLVKPFKLGELAGQQNSCPIQRAEGLRERVDFLRSHFDGFRIRNVQLSGIISAEGSFDSTDEQTALFLAACGSIAVIAKEYKSNSDKTLLAKGVLPLISQKPVPVGTFVLIRNIRRDVYGGKLEAYVVYPDRLEEIEISLPEYTDKELEFVLR